MTTPFARRVRKLFAGEAELTGDAFADLYRSHLGRVFNYVRYRLGPDEAEDVTADIFVRAWSRRETYDARKGSQSTWLWAITRNLVTDRLRRRQLNQVVISSDLPSNDDPFAELSKREEWEQVWVAITRLRQVDQDIIALRFGAGHTNRAIAELLGLSEANVSQRLRRALRKIRAELGETETHE